MFLNFRNNIISFSNKKTWPKLTFMNINISAHKNKFRNIFHIFRNRIRTSLSRRREGEEEGKGKGREEWKGKGRGSNEGRSEREGKK